MGIYVTIKIRYRFGSCSPFHVTRTTWKPVWICLRFREGDKEGGYVYLLQVHTMRFRIKLPNCTTCVVVNVEESDNLTLGSLKSATVEALKNLGIVGTQFELSLNGQDPILGDELTLNELGLVSGDILRILTPTPNQEHKNQTSVQIDERIEEDGPSSPVASSSGQSADADTSMAVDGEQPVDKIVVNRCLNEPILCRESTPYSVPEVLKQCYQSSAVETVYDALVVALHVMMLEAGFFPSMVRDDGNRVPASTKLGHVYRIPYCHTSCPNSTAVLTCVIMGPILSVNGSCASVNFHYTLKPCHFVRNDYFNASAVHSVYQNLSKLSHQFKDTVVYPLLTAMQEEEGIPFSCGMMSLATEIKLLILSYLNVRSLLHMSEVCREFRTLADESALWKRLCFIDFPANMSQSFITETSISWKHKYRILYKSRKSNPKHVCSVFPYPPPAYHIPPFQGLFPPRAGFGPPLMPPGILGGDYDRIPSFTGDTKWITIFLPLKINVVVPERGPMMPPPGPRLFHPGLPPPFPPTPSMPLSHWPRYLWFH
uniref:F-box domain-containing protein n=1 Tax=Strigamia maritima TaxID=126957 RepID=T1IWE7_STRMM